MPDPLLLDLLHDATQRLVRSVDAMDDAAWRHASDLPGWTRGHVVAHLTLNAEGLAGALEGLARGEQVPMYLSPEARDGDIDDLSTSDVAPVRDRLLASTSRFLDAVRLVPEDAWEHSIERVPGGRTFRAAAVPAMRWREVEIHHADLGAGYGPQDWSAEFGDALVDAMADRVGAPTGFRVRLSDADRVRDLGSDLPDDAPVVTGTAASVGWWLSGRGDGSDLTCDRGPLPQIGTW